MNADGTGFVLLHSFAHDYGQSEGANPRGALLQAADGALYGTTFNGGKHSAGTLFTIKRDGTGYQVLHSFTGDDGSNPPGAMI